MSLKQLENEFKNKAKNWKKRGNKTYAKKQFNTAILMLRDIKENDTAVIDLKDINEKHFRSYFDRMKEKDRSDATIYDHFRVAQKITKEVLNWHSELKKTDVVKQAREKLFSVLKEQQRNRSYTKNELIDKIEIYQKKIKILQKKLAEFEK